MRVLIDRLEQNEKRMNDFCVRLSLLDPTFNKQQIDEQPYSEEELKIIEDVRRECKSLKVSNPRAKCIVFNTVN